MANTAVLGTKYGDRMYRAVMVQVKQETMTRTNALVSSYSSVWGYQTVIFYIVWRGMAFKNATRF